MQVFIHLHSRGQTPRVACWAPVEALGEDLTSPPPASGGSGHVPLLSAFPSAPAFSPLVKPPLTASGPPDSRVAASSFNYTAKALFFFFFFLP